MSPVHKIGIGKVENILKGSLDSIPSLSHSSYGRRCKGKTLLGLSTNFWKQKVCWHHPAMFCLITSSKLSANNLNFHWRRRWWDRIQAIFLNLFYFMYTKIKMRISKCFGPSVLCRALQQNWVRLFAMHGLSAIELESSINLKLKQELGVWLIS